VVTKKTSSKPNITHLTVPSSVTTTITNKTAGEYRARAREFYIRDQKLTGFWIRVNPNGRKVYGCYGRLFGNKETVRVTIGNTELFTAAQARKEAEKHLREIRSGISPKAVSKAERDRAVNTLETLIPEYISIRELAPRTQHDIPYRVHRHMGALVKKDVGELTVDDLRLWWQKKQAKGSKEVCLRYVSALLTYAQARGLVERNVAQDFRKGILGGLKQRDPKKRHISIYDIEDWVYSFLNQSVPHPSYKKQNGQWEIEPRVNSPAIWNSNPTISETQRDYILFLLITGKRKEEAARITWSDVQFRKSIATITLKKTKSGKVDVIPMTNLMWHMIKYRQESPNKHPKWVFPNRYGSGPINNVRKTLEKICHHSIDNFSIDLPETISVHDLRRTFATMSAELGMTKGETAILLNHSQRDVTEGYISRSLGIKLENIERVEKHLLPQIGANPVHGWIKVHWYGGNENWWDTAPPAPEEEPIYY
jgi:integrase